MAVKMIPEKIGEVKEKTKDWRRPVRSPMEMSRVCVGCQVYTGPNSNESGPRGAVRPSSPVRAYAGDVLNLIASLTRNPCGLKPWSGVLRRGRKV